MFAALKKVKNGIMVASGASFVLMGVYGLHIFDAEGASADTRLVSIASTGSGEYVTISSGGDINMTIVPTADGTLGAVESDVTVKTSVASGYSLYLNMANSAGSNVLYNTTDTSSYLSAAAGTPSTPATLAINQWGFAIANNTTDKSSNLGTFSDSYTTPEPLSTSLWSLIPTMTDASYTGKIKETSAADTTGTTLPVYIGAKIDNNLAAGNYNGYITFSAMANYSATAGTATISPTTAGPGDTVTITTTTNSAMNVASDQISVSVGGYNCQNPTANTATGTLVLTCTLPTNIPAGTYSGSNIVVTVAKFGMTYTVTNNLTVANGTSLQNSATPLTMQNVTPSMCNNTPLYSVSGETYWLVDSRDGNYYGVRKLADNKCWMVTNLKLAGGTTISSADSNLSSGSYKLPNSSTSGFDSDTGQFMYNGNDTTGAYYSYLTATAGTGASVTSDGGQASGSICPKKWRLPTGNASTGEFTALYSAYGSNKTNLDAAWSPVYVGLYNGSTLYDSGTLAYWWSSTSVSSTNARYLGENTSGGINPANSNRRRNGFSVRCVLGS